MPFLDHGKVVAQDLCGTTSPELMPRRFVPIAESLAIAFPRFAYPPRLETELVALFAHSSDQDDSHDFRYRGSSCTLRAERGSRAAIGSSSCFLPDIRS